MTGITVTGCASRRFDRNNTLTPPALENSLMPGSSAMYGAINDGGFNIPAVDLNQVPEQFRRQQVQYPTPEPPGSIIIDTSAFYLYFVQPGGTAMRYGVGLGRAGFGWSGRATVGNKRVWPKWFPPAEMIERQPELAKYSAENGGMDGGPENPLGARALYLYEGNKDTLYRIHGSPEFWSIGKAVSSGCVRMINQDAIDLYDRVPMGAPVTVI